MALSFKRSLWSCLVLCLLTAPAWGDKEGVSVESPSTSPPAAAPASDTPTEAARASTESEPTAPSTAKAETEKSKDEKAPIHLTLSQSVSIGLKGATSVLKASNDYDLSGTQLLQGYGQFLPSVVATGTYTFNSGNDFFYSSIPTLVNSRNYGPALQLSATLNLFNGLSDFSSLKAALERRSAAELTLARAKEQIALDITQAYLQVILDRHIVQIAEKNYATSEERQRLLREQTRVGVRNISDLFRQEAQTSSDQSFLINNQNKLRDDQISLLRRLRLDTEKNYEYEEPDLYKSIAKDDYPKEEELIKTALDNRRDLKAAKANFESADWNVGVARSGYLPRLDLAVNLFSAGRYYNDLSINGVNSLPPGQQEVWDQLGGHTYYSVGVTLTWNLFDRFQTGLNVGKAAVAANNARIDFEDSRIQVVGEIRQAYGDYRGALQNLQASKIGLQAAEKAYEVTKGRYEVGSASFLDLSTSQVVLVQAETTRIQAQIAFLLQRKMIEFYLGKIPTDGTVEF